jgi:hypothetical protein
MRWILLSRQFFHGLRIMQQVLVSVHRQTAGEICSGEACAMPGLGGRVNDVSLIGDEDGQRADFVLDFAQENDPKFGLHFVKMAFVVFRRGSLRLGVRR